MHEAERIVAAPGGARFESVERAFVAIYREVLSFVTDDLEASLWPPQQDKWLYQLFCSADTHGGRQLIPRPSKVLNAPLDAMSVAFAKPFKVRNWRSHKVSAPDMEPLFTMQLRGVASDDEERNIHDLPDLRSHGRVEAVYNNATFRTHRSSVCEKRGRSEVHWGANHLDLRPET